MNNKTLLLTFILITNSLVSQAQTKWGLQQCVDYAIANNLTIKRIELSNQQLELNKETAKTNFLPTVNGSASQNFNFGQSTNSITNIRESANSRSNSFGINASVPLFTSGRNKETLEKANLQLEQRDLILKDAENDLALQIANQYLQILFQKENIRVAKNQLELSKIQYDRVQKMIAAGAMAEADRYDLEASVATDEQKLIQAQNNHKLAIENLKLTLQLEGSFNVEDIDIESISPNLLYSSAEQVYATAKENWPSIQRLKMAEEVSAKDVNIAKTWKKPQLSLSAFLGSNYFHQNGTPDKGTVQGLDGNSVAYDNSFLKQLDNNFSQSVGLSLNIPIFNPSNDIQIQQAEIGVKQAELDTQQEELTLKQNITQAFIDAQNSQQNYEALKASRYATQKAFEVTRKRVEAGLSNNFDLNNSKLRLEQTEYNLVNAKYDYLFKVKVLDYYVGKGF